MSNLRSTRYFQPSIFAVLSDSFQFLLGHFGLIGMRISFDHPFEQIPGVRLIPEFQESEACFNRAAGTLSPSGYLAITFSYSKIAFS